MIACLLLVALARARGEMEVIAGGRSAPEATVQVPEAGDQLEPAALVAIAGHVETAPGEGFWARGDGSLWALTEDDARLIEVRPALGWGARSDTLGSELAATWQGQAYPWNTTASNGRTEAYADGNVSTGDHRFDLSVLGVDRRYPWKKEWGFSTVEPGVGWHWEHGLVRGAVGAAWQGNAGSTIAADGSLDRSTGWQLRADVELGIATRRWDVWARYAPISAYEGDYAEAAQPQFTPIGDYEDDADALSAGGFFQHRIDTTIAWESDSWSVRAEGLGRLRESQPGDLAASFARTLHGQLSVDRVLAAQSPDWSWVAVLGVSAAELVDGRGYTDVYGWAGVRWHPAQ
jgi:hypothetical protein